MICCNHGNQGIDIESEQNVNGIQMIEYMSKEKHCVHYIKLG